MIAPKPIDYSKIKDKPKNIVILGTGMVGLFSAYYLSNNPLNKIVILEKEGAPYTGSSKQNGNWSNINFSQNWMNLPLYPWVYKALFDN